MKGLSEKILKIQLHWSNKIIFSYRITDTFNEFVRYCLLLQIPYYLRQYFVLAYLSPPFSALSFPRVKATPSYILHHSLHNKNCIVRFVRSTTHSPETVWSVGVNYIIHCNASRVCLGSPVNTPPSWNKQNGYTVLLHNRE